MSKVYWNTLYKEYVNNVTVEKRRIHAAADQILGDLGYYIEWIYLEEVPLDIQNLVELLYVEK